MINAKAYATHGPTNPLGPFQVKRRSPGPEDVQIDVLFCGVCHSDLHTARDEWKNTIYPCVPGHEIVGRVVAVGSKANKFKEGDIAAVGCMVDSCGRCESCLNGLEQYCEEGFVATYKRAWAGEREHLRRLLRNDRRQGILRAQGCPYRELGGGGPLVCAGITTYSPLRHWSIGPGKKVGVVGLGGLGHMAIKLAHAMGAHVVLFTTSPGKAEDARRLGADEVVVSKNQNEMAAHKNSFHFMLDTVSAPHRLDDYLNLLKRDGTLVLVGAPSEPHPSPDVFSLVFKRRQIAGSLIGGIQETQEMLDFCAKHGIVSDIELIPIQAINEAYERMLKSDVKYRFVIDMKSLKA